MALYGIGARWRVSQCMFDSELRTDITPKRSEKIHVSHVRNEVAAFFCTQHKHKSGVELKAIEKYPMSRDFAPHKVNFKKLDTRLTVAYCAFGAPTKLTYKTYRQRPLSEILQT